MSQAPINFELGLSEVGPPVVDHGAHRAERGRRVKSAVFTALLTKPLALFTPLITAKLYYKYLGRERYGLYEAVVALSMLLALSNGGLALGLMNRLMDCHVSDNRELARRYVSSLMLILASIVGLGLLIWTVLSLAVDWNHFFRVTDPRALHETSWIVWITGISTLLGLLFGLPASIYMAYQELTRANLWDAAAKVFTLAACIAVVYTKFGLIGVALASTSAGTFVALLNTIAIFWEKPWITPRLRFFEWRLVKSTMGDSLLLFALQSSVVAIFTCDKLVIGKMLGPAAVTNYALTGRLFLVTYGIFMVVLSPLWPAHGEALRRGDIAWVRKGLRVSLICGFVLISGCGIVLFFFGNPIFRHWTGATNVSRSLILAMTAMFLLRAWVDSRSVILNSANVLMPQVYFFIAHAASNLALAIFLAPRFGATGVAWATPITALLTSAWGYPWMMRRLIRAQAPRDRAGN